MIGMSGTGAAMTLAIALAWPAPGSAESEPAAVAIAERVLERLGGRDAWRGTRYLRFDWAVERGGEQVVRRGHFWDKWTGDYRLEAATGEGAAYVVVMNLNTREGHAWSGDEELAGEALQKHLEDAFGAWTNDTYWLLAPFKLLDPGVSLTLAGEESEGGTTWDRLELSFDGVGLTPKDRYWVWVNRETGLVDRWDYVLKGEDGPPTSWTWEGWARHGRIELPNDHRILEGDARIHFPVLAVPDALPEGWKTSGERLAE
jgi:hypothetical protein